MAARKKTEEVDRMIGPLRTTPQGGDAVDGQTRIHDDDKRTRRRPGRNTSPTRRVPCARANQKKGECCLALRWMSRVCTVLASQREDIDRMMDASVVYDL